MKKILITGANGFLGKDLLKKILDDGHHEVVSLTRRKEYMQINYPEVDHYDMDDFNLNQIPFEEMDVVVHCAFSRGSSGAELSASLKFTSELFEKIHKDIVNISSRSVYGQNPQIPWIEATPAQPDQPYGLAKFATEQMLSLMQSRGFSGHATSIRLAGLVGAGFEDRVVNKFVNQVIKGEKIKIKGGDQQFSYLHVDDAVDGINTFLNVPSSCWKPLYNLGYLNSYSILEIAEVVNDVAKNFGQSAVDIEVEKSELALFADLDSKLFYDACGWVPKFDMTKIVHSIFENKINGLKK